MKLSELLAAHGDLHVVSTRDPFSNELYAVTLQDDEGQVHNTLAENPASNAGINRDDAKWRLLCSILSDMSQGKLDESSVFQVVESMVPDKNSSTAPVLSPKEVSMLIGNALPAIDSLERVNEQTSAQSEQG